MDFLTFLYEHNVSHSSINTARSALCSIIKFNCTTIFGQLPVVTQFMTGMYELRPCLLKHHTIRNFKTELQINHILTYGGYVRFHDLWMQASSEYDIGARAENSLLKENILRYSVHRVGRAREWHIDCLLAPWLGSSLLS